MRIYTEEEPDLVHFAFNVNNINHILLSNMDRIMQALAAASKTVDYLKIVHSLHAYFLLVGDFNSKYLCLKQSEKNYDLYKSLKFSFVSVDYTLHQFHK